VPQDTIAGSGQEETSLMKEFPPVQCLFTEKEESLEKASPLNDLNMRLSSHSCVMGHIEQQRSK
jgi:hypothetical protein